MKKSLCVLATGIALSMCAVTAFFAKHTVDTASAASVDAYNSAEIARVATDTDADQGVCVGGNNFVDEDGDGVCDNKGAGQGHGNCGKNFVDEDGDGVCDNKGAGQCHGNGNVGGGHHGKGSRGHCGR